MSTTNKEQREEPMNFISEAFEYKGGKQ